MSIMHARLISTTIMRLVFAVLFGVMSVLPVPLRALGLPISVPHAHAATVPDSGHPLAAHRRHHGNGAAGHHHGDHLGVPTSAGEPATLQPTDSGIPCHSAPCCMAVTQPAPSAPATVLLLLGQLAFPPAQTIVAVTPDPAVPPPRLQA